jgi:hypothetical protein
LIGERTCESNMMRTRRFRVTVQSVMVAVAVLGLAFAYISNIIDASLLEKTMSENIIY